MEFVLFVWYRHLSEPQDLFIYFVSLLSGNEADRAAFRPSRADCWEPCLVTIYFYHLML